MSTEAKKAAAEEAITKEALTRYQATTGPRLREIILSLIKHLHGFARDVRLTGDEYLFAMNYLVQLGGYCKGGRQEFLALAAMLGLETLVIQISQPKPKARRCRACSDRSSFRTHLFGTAPTSPKTSRASRSTSRGVFSRSIVGLFQTRPSTSGNRTGGGLYDVQGDLAKDGMRTRGQLKSEPDGRYSFWMVVPIGYPVPNDGGMGDLVKYTDGVAAGARSLHDRGRWPRHPGDANLRARQ